MTIEAKAEEVVHHLIGPHSRYSKIGRIRREKLRAEIKTELMRFYKMGRCDAADDLAKSFAPHLDCDH